jgi:lipoyl(octanoyl) transferase
MRWHFFSTGADSGPCNMAVDEALMRYASRATTPAAHFRVYGWSRPTLSLGRNQRARGAYDEQGARAMGVDFVRRPTGGRALLHDHEVTYSVVLPAADAAEARAAYDFINEILLAGLGRLGVRAERAAGTHNLPPGPRPCFDVPADREISYRGRKLVGSAQWRRDGVLLQHGSILVRDDQGLIQRLMRAGSVDAETPTPRAATLGEAMGREPGADEVAEALRVAMRELAGSADDFEPQVLASDVRELTQRYSDPEWTWRR